MIRRPRDQRDEAGVALILAVVVMFVVVILGLTAVSQTTSALFQSRNTNAQVGSNLEREAPQVVLSGSTSINGAAGTVCNSSATGSPAGAFSTNTAPCTNSMSPSAVATTTAASATTRLASAGTVVPTNTTVSAAACGLAQMPDSAANGTDTALLYGGATYGIPFAPLNSTAMTFNGRDGWGETFNRIVAPDTFTLTAWFKTTASGSIIGLSSAQGVSGQTNWDRMLWIDPTGQVVFGANPASAGVTEMRSPGTTSYNDGDWHFVAATVSPFGGALYIDGSNVATSAAMTAGESYSGWWHLGWSNAQNSWPDPPTSAYYAGALAEVAEFPTALSAAAVAALYATSGSTAGTAYVADTPTNFTNDANYSAVQAADGPNDVWALSGSGSTPYTGPVPGGSTPDVTNNHNDAALQGGATVGEPGPFASNSLGVTLTGAPGTYAATTVAATAPFPVTEMAWFKTATDGALMGSDTTESDGGAGNWDRMLYVDDAGHLVYGVYNGDTTEITSPGTYDDDQWHLAVASAGPAGDQLYVDGALVASNGATTSNDREVEYWHLGFAYTAEWGDQPADPYFDGSLAQEAVFPTQLTGDQVASLYSATATATDASMYSQVMSLSPTYYWPLDQGLYLCAVVGVTLQASLDGSPSYCLLGSGACAPGPAVTFASLPWSYSYAGPLSAASVTVSTALVGAVPTGAVGLHVLGSFAVVGSAPIGTGGAVSTAQLVYAQTGAQL